MPYLRRDGTVFVLDLGVRDQPDTENRLSPAWIDEVNTCLDEVEASTGAAALVTTGTGKFYSNGFEPERFLGTVADTSAYLLTGQQLFARLLAFPMPTVAALQGHTFAGGAIFAMAHDARVMRSDRGFFCLPEISLGLTLPDGLILPTGMVELLRGRLPVQTAHEAILTGRRYTGPEALNAGIVDATAGPEVLQALAIARAEAAAHTRGPALAAMKSHLHREILTALAAVDHS